MCLGISFLLKKKLHSTRNAAAVRGNAANKLKLHSHLKSNNLYKAVVNFILIHILWRFLLKISDVRPALTVNYLRY